jgi:hypothetical protein
VAIVNDGAGLPKTVELSALLFSVIAVLLVEAKRATASRGFMTAAEIYSQLKSRGVEVDPDRITALIFRLRGRFARLRRPEAAGRKWARQLVETHKQLGYRLSTLPENLEIEIIEPSENNDLPKFPTPNAPWC